MSVITSFSRSFGSTLAEAHASQRPYCPTLRRSAAEGDCAELILILVMRASAGSPIPQAMGTSSRMQLDEWTHVFPSSRVPSSRTMLVCAAQSNVACERPRATRIQVMSRRRFLLSLAPALAAPAWAARAWAATLRARRRAGRRPRIGLGAAGSRASTPRQRARAGDARRQRVDRARRHRAEREARSKVRWRRSRPGEVERFEIAVAPRRTLAASQGAADQVDLSAEDLAATSERAPRRGAADVQRLRAATLAMLQPAPGSARARSGCAATSTPGAQPAQRHGLRRAAGTPVIAANADASSTPASTSSGPHHRPRPRQGSSPSTPPGAIDAAVRKPCRRQRHRKWAHRRITGAHLHFSVYSTRSPSTRRCSCRIRGQARLS